MAFARQANLLRIYLSGAILMSCHFDQSFETAHLTAIVTYSRKSILLPYMTIVSCFHKLSDLSLDRCLSLNVLSEILNKNGIHHF
jgi:hypothetical protein